MGVVSDVCVFGGASVVGCGGGGGAVGGYAGTDVAPSVVSVLSSFVFNVVVELLSALLLRFLNILKKFFCSRHPSSGWHPVTIALCYDRSVLPVFTIKHTGSYKLQ